MLTHTENFEEVKTQVMEAYCDCNYRGINDRKEALDRRSLTFKASSTVNRQEAFEIMTAALDEGSFNDEDILCYNDFEPQMILDHFPEDAKFILAREGSVCLYVNGKKLPKGIANEEDSMYIKGKVYKRYWWD